MRTDRICCGCHGVLLCSGTSSNEKESNLINRRLSFISVLLAPPNEMYGSNAPHPKEAPPSSLQPEIGQMTYGTLLESPGESRPWYAIRGPKGAVRWGRFHLSCCPTASATATESSTTASGPSRLIATGLDALSSFTASAIRPGYRGLPHARRPHERLIARGRRAPTNDCNGAHRATSEVGRSATVESARWGHPEIGVSGKSVEAIQSSPGSHRAVRAGTKYVSADRGCTNPSVRA
jgi:hypothetical protein